MSDIKEEEVFFGLRGDYQYEPANVRFNIVMWALVLALIFLMIVFQSPILKALAKCFPN